MPGTLKLKSEAGGSVILTANTTAASDLSLTIPPYAGTMATLVANTTGPYFSVPNVTSNGPAFSAYSSSTQNPSSGVLTKVVFGATSFDTNNNYNTSTSRFTPTVAGYYQLNVSVAMAADTTITGARLIIYKNGAGVQIPSMENTNSGGNGTGYYTPSLSALVYANGTSDYFEVYGQVDGTGTLRYFFSSNAGLHSTVFQGYLVRSA
jgi:hypothetical protein